MGRHILFLVLLFGAVKVQAQYPTVRPALQDSTDRELAKAEKLSDAAWEKARAAMAADKKNGKPYIPWASDPEDLRLSDAIPYELKPALR